jgi:hypothetical protein
MNHHPMGTGSRGPLGATTPHAGATGEGGGHLSDRAFEAVARSRAFTDPGFGFFGDRASRPGRPALAAGDRRMAPMTLRGGVRRAGLIAAPRPRSRPVRCGIGRCTSRRRRRGSRRRGRRCRGGRVRRGRRTAAACRGGRQDGFNRPGAVGGPVFGDGLDLVVCGVGVGVADDVGGASPARPR